MNKFITTIYIITAFLAAKPCAAHFSSKGPYGGSVGCAIAYDTVVYIGTPTGGVYMSSNSQLAAWTPRPVGLKSGNIHALAHTGTYLFTATDSGVYRFTGFIGNDRYWEKTNAGITASTITSLIAIDSITLLAGTLGDGVFRTLDKGASWSAANNAIQHFNVNGFTWAGHRLIQISDGGVWASDDSAKSWFDFTDGFTNDINATAVSYNPITDQLLVYNTNGLHLLNAASTTNTPAYVSANTGLPVNAIIRNISNDGSKWYLATDYGVYTSSASSISWTAENGGLETQNISVIIPFQTRLLAGTYNDGIYKTSASNINWTATNNGFNNLKTYSMIAKDTVLVIAATEKGVFVSTNLATSYARANNGLTDSLNVTDITFFGTKLIASTKYEGVFISADTGKTWTTFNTNLNNLFITKVFASNSFTYIFDNNGGIWQSDLSNGWTSITGTGLTGSAIPTSMAFSNGTIFLGTHNANGVYTRSEAGGDWTPHDNGITSQINAIAVNNQNKVFAGTDKGVFVADASNFNWWPTASFTNSFITTMGLQSTEVQALGFYAGYLFASIRGSVIASDDNGVTWDEAGTQFNYPSFSDINKLSFVTTRLFATTQNNSLYSNGLSELPPAAVHALSDEPSFIVSPNPSNGTFTMDYSAIKGKVESVELFDVTGKLVEQFNTDKKSFSLAYAKGLYMLKVTTANGSRTQRIVLE